MSRAPDLTEPRVERVPLTGDTRQELLDLGLPEPIADAWGRFVHPLLRTVLIVRESAELTGAALVVNRALGRYVRLVGVWSGPAAGASSVPTALMEELERFAHAAGAVVIKHELADSSALEALLATDPDGRLVPVPAPTMAGPIPDVIDFVPQAAFAWRSQRAATRVPYVRQTTDFTCGPAALLMALSHLHLHPQPTREAELCLWREATQVEACDPYGLALAAAVRGARVELTITTDDFILLEGFTNEQAIELRRFIQSDFRRRARAAGVVTEVRAFTEADVRRELESGKIVLLLVDQRPFHCETCPHWIVVHDLVEGLFLIHDPWTEVLAGETWLDGYDLPLSGGDLEGVGRFGSGEKGYGAMLALSADPPAPRTGPAEG